jgi:TRAP-type C4-dicarboxylate transport system substrate-binding protein
MSIWRQGLLPRALVALGLATALGVAWVALERVALDVVGQPSSTGAIQSQLEKPFFETLAATTGLPLEVRYRTLDQVGFKDTHQLAMLGDGTFDLVSLRFLQNTKSEPTLLGIDLPGLNTDFETAQMVIKAYQPVLERRFQQRYGAKLLGIWTFGPQVFFCRQPVKTLADLTGLRVRVGGATIAPVITAAGGTPVIVPFDDVLGALKNDMVDCAVTSSGSANFAGWPQYASHYFPLPTQMGLNGYAISLRAWNALSSRQQQVLQDAFTKHIEAIWAYARELHEDTSSCNVGGPCSLGKRYNMILVQPAPADAHTLRAHMLDGMQQWAQDCDQAYPGCSDEWHRLIAPILQTTGDDKPWGQHCDAAAPGCTDELHTRPAATVEGRAP